jgi:hypothetical protein
VNHLTDDFLDIGASICHLVYRLKVKLNGSEGDGMSKFEDYLQDVAAGLQTDLEGADNWSEEDWAEFEDECGDED